MGVSFKSVSRRTIESFVRDFGIQLNLQELKNYAEHGYVYNTLPVDIKTFCLHSEYLQAVDEHGVSIIWPKVMECLEELNSGHYEEAILSGSIGSAKSTIALYTQAYQLYLLSCYENPHKVFGLDPASEILIIFQSLTETLASEVDYARFKSMIDRSPYFRQHFWYDKSLKSSMNFRNRIVVKPVSSTMAGPLGQNVIGGLIDEVNFMAIVDKSKRVRGTNVFDQAKMLYESIDRRRRSRFMVKGKLPGILCMASSKWYPGEFTERKIEEARREKEQQGNTTIYVYDKRSWDVAPEGRFSDDRFRIFVGDETRKPRVLGPSEKIVKADQNLVDYIPVEYYNKFQEDIYGALRDIAGHSTKSRHPFMMNVEAVASCFGVVESVLSLDECDFETMLLKFFPKKFKNTQLSRWVHIDLGLVSDSAGIACGYVEKFKKIDRGDQWEILPVITYDFILRVPPPKGGEIKFFKIRELIYKIRDAGLNIKFVSFDSWQSTDSLQLMQQKGFITGTVSMDTSELPYDFCKSAFYDRRVNAPEHERAKAELLALERDPKKGKIDHPPLGSKDTSDAIAGVIYGLTTRREIWVEHDVTVIEHYERMVEKAKVSKNKKTVSL